MHNDDDDGGGPQQTQACANQSLNSQTKNAASTTTTTTAKHRSDATKQTKPPQAQLQQARKQRRRRRHRRRKPAIATWPLARQPLNSSKSFGDADDLGSSHLKGSVLFAKLTAKTAAASGSQLSATRPAPLKGAPISDAAGNAAALISAGDVPSACQAGDLSHRRPFGEPFERPSTNWCINATTSTSSDEEEAMVLQKNLGRRRRSYDDQEGDNDISIIMQCDYYNTIDEEQQSNSEKPLESTKNKLELAKSLLDLDYNLTVRLFIQKSSLNWNFNSFTFDALCCGRSLTELLLHLFDYYNLHNIFKLNIINVLKCFRLLEFGYHSTNPYHNSIHAADVTQAMHCFIQESKIRKHMTDLETLCSILAAVCHDLDHPGVNQNFLVATKNPLVSLYKNCSVLENHHWHFALAIFKESAIFDHLSDDIKTELKKQLRTLILATDIAHQNEYLKRFKELTASSKFSMLNVEDRSLVLQMALKCADLGNPCRPWILSKCWSEQICTEFYRQGDFERQLAIQLTPMCQRKKASVASIQSDFFKIIVLPLLELWHQFLRSPLSRLLMTNLNHNYERWQKANRIVQQMRRRKSFASLEPVLDNSGESDNADNDNCKSEDPTFDEGLNEANCDITKNKCRHMSIGNVRRKAISDLVKSDNERLHHLRILHLDRIIQRVPKFVM